MYGINRFILNQERNDYSGHLSDFDYKLDCSMGSNPYGAWPGLTCPPSLISGIAEYPHSDFELRDAIAKYFSDSTDLTDSHVCLTCGSIGSVLALNRMLLRENRVIVGIAPQFSAVVDDFVTYGADYKPVFLLAENSYQFIPDDFMHQLAQYQGAYVYIDNPNNPTGQIIDLASIEKIVVQAKEKDSFVVIDEAYGDYMDNSISAINLVNRYDNLAVIRTFSKGFGAAGVRLGYIIAQPKIVELVNKVNVPFSNNSVANHIALQLLSSDWVEKSVARVKDAKMTLMNALSSSVIKVAHTGGSVPISMLYLDNKDVNLSAVLEKAGLRAITGVGYDGIGKNCVRLNVHINMTLLVECLKDAEKLLVVQQA